MKRVAVSRIDLRGRVTLMCVETRSLPLALNAIRRCIEGIEFDEVLLFTNQDWRIEGVRVVCIPNINSASEYSRFMMSDFHREVRTSHFLVIQWDGFVLNPAAWTDEFLRFDYIGATWPHRNGVVGNGGFSLRSVKMHRVLSSMEHSNVHPEDSFICLWHRRELEDQGLKFGSSELAERFSFEGGRPVGRPFGFHGFGNFNAAFSEHELLSFLNDAPLNIIYSQEGRSLLKVCLKMRRMAVARWILARRLARGGRMAFDTLWLYFRYMLRGWVWRAD